MFKKINFKMLAMAVGSFAVGLGTMYGVVQNYVHFAGVENEMGFAFFAFMIGILGLFGIKN
jgi:hypothetical protein